MESSARRSERPRPVAGRGAARFGCSPARLLARCGKAGLVGVETLEPRQLLNTEPFVEVFGDISTREGQWAEVYAQYSDEDTPPEDLIVTIDWGDGHVEQYDPSVFGLSAGELLAQHVYADNGTYAASITVSDGDLETAALFQASVANVAPRLWLGGKASVNEGTFFTLTVGKDDPGQDTVSGWVIDWGDGQSQGLSGSATSATHWYRDGFTRYNIKATATDEDGVYTTTGLTFDPAQGGLRGQVVTDVLGGYDRAVAAFPLSGGQMLAVGSGGTPNGLVFVKYLASGAVDGSFGQGGRVTHAGHAIDAITQTDGKIVVIGQTSLSTTVRRFNANGTPDEGFGTNGTVTIPNAVAGRVALSGSKIVVRARAAYSNATLVVRLHPNGGFDETFSGDGIADITVANDASYSYSAGLLVLGDGSVVVGGFSFPAGGGGIWLAKLKADGARDDQFGNGGTAFQHSGASAYPTDLVQLSSGRILATAGNGRVLRFTAGGLNDGEAAPIIPGFQSHSMRMTKDAAGRAVVVTESPLQDGIIVLRRIGAGGTVDTSYGVAGERRAHIGRLAGGTTLAKLTVRSDGALLLAGGTIGPGNTSDMTVSTLPAESHLAVQDVAPSIQIGRPELGAKGEPYRLRVAGYDPGLDTITSWKVDWGDGSDEEVEGGLDAELVHVYEGDPLEHEIKVYANNEDGQFEAEVYWDLAPVIEDLNGGDGLEGRGAGVSGYFYDNEDPNYESMTLRIDWGDGTPAEDYDPYQSGSPGYLDAQHVYADNGEYSGTVTIDDGLQSRTYKFSVRVANVAPRLLVSGNASVVDAQEYELTLGAEDPGPDTVSAWRVQWGDGHVTTVGGAVRVLRHRFAGGPRPYTITVTATDEDGQYTTAGLTYDLNAGMAQGRSTADFGGSTDVVQRVFALPDGKTVLAGTSNSRFALARLTSAGALDTTFDGDGKAVDASWNTSWWPLSVDRQPDGKFVVLSMSYAYPTSSYRLTRYLENGTPDAPFGSVAVGLGAATQVRVHPDGWIYVVGSTAAGGAAGEMAVLRFTLAGAADTGFGINGRATVGFGAAGGGRDIAHAIAFGPQQTLVIVGNAGSLATWAQGLGVARLLADGSRDTSFAPGGMVRHSNLFSSNSGDLVIQSDKSAVLPVAGGRVVRLTPAGGVDPSFAYTPGSYSTSKLAADAAGRLIVVNQSYASGDHSRADVHRFLASGAPDTSFGAAGVRSALLGRASDHTASLMSVGVLPSGTVVVGGQVYQAGTGADFVAAFVGVNASVTVTPVPPTLVISGEAVTDLRSLYRLRLSATGPGASGLQSWTINWGDGSEPQVVHGSATFAEHRYESPTPAGGPAFTISATATGVAGTHSAAPLQVTVRNEFVLDAVVRDFKREELPGGHPDFEVPNFDARTGIVENLLLPDGTPDFRLGQGSVISETSFYQWYHDGPYSLARSLPMRFVPKPGAPGVYVYGRDPDGSAAEFFPVDGQLWADPRVPAPYRETTPPGTGTGTHNYHFTTTFRARFVYQPGQTIRYVADDDMWIFINGRLAADEGGAHNSVDRTHQLSTLNTQRGLGLVPGQEYSIALFMAERRIPESEFLFETNAPLRPESLVELIEGDRLLTEPPPERAYEFVAAAGVASIELPVHALAFDRLSTGRISDAFEIAVVDAAGRPLVPTIWPGREAVLNVSEGRLPAAAQPDVLGSALRAPGVKVENGRVKIDVSAIPHGTRVRVLARLLNNDGDASAATPAPADVQTRALLGGELVLSSAPVSDAGNRPAGAPGAPAPGRPVDFGVLENLSSRFDVTYGFTSLNRASSVLVAELAVALRPGPDQAVRGPVLAVLRNLRPRGAAASVTRAFEPDGFTPDGAPYFNVSRFAFSAADRVLAAGDSFRAPVRFVNDLWADGHPADQFDFDLEVWGAPNQAPEFSSTPRTSGVTGSPYAYQAVAMDPEADAVTYRLIAGPVNLGVTTGGLVTWSNPAPGTSVVVVRATDQYGAFADQVYNLTIGAGGNHPPRFTTLPGVDAFSGRPYLYDADALDPDAGAVLGFDLTAAFYEGNPVTIDHPAGMAVISSLGLSLQLSTGRVSWTPEAAHAGRRVDLVLRVADQHGAADFQTYTIVVHPDPSNSPPAITSRPQTNFAQAGAAVGNDPRVTPQSINLALGAGQQSQPVPVHVNLPAGASHATIVFVVDQSGSMANAQSWVGAMVDDLDAQLSMLGVGSRAYGLVGYSSAPVPILIDDGNGPSLLYGTAAQLADAALRLNTAGGADEFGYEAVQFVMAGDMVPDDPDDPDSLGPQNYFTAREDGAFIVVLVSDESNNLRRNGADADFEAIRDLLAANSSTDTPVLLHTVVSATYGAPVLASFDDQGYAPVAGTWRPVGRGIKMDSSRPNATGAWAATGVGPSAPAIVLRDDPFTGDPDVPLQFRTGLVIDAGLNGRGGAARVILDYRSPTDYVYFELDADAETVSIGHSQGTRATQNLPAWYRTSAFEPLEISLTLDTSDPSAHKLDYEIIGIDDLQPVWPDDTTARGQFTSPILRDLLPDVSKFGFGVASGGAAFGAFRGPDGATASFLFASWQTFAFDVPDPGSDWTTEDFLGVRADRSGLVANGAGGTAPRSGAQLHRQLEAGGGPAQFAGSENGYAELAWATGGVTWDISQLRLTDPLNADSPLDPAQKLALLASFTGAFAAELASDIAGRLAALAAVSPTGQDLSGIVHIQRVDSDDFLVTFTGDGGSHAFDLRFTIPADNNAEAGVIPVSINGGVYEYQLTAIDPDGDAPLTFAWAPGYSPPAGATLTPQGFLRWTPPQVTQNTDQTFSVQVSDGRGGTDVQTWTLTLRPTGSANGPPTITTVQADVGSAQHLRGYSLRIQASDPDGDQLRYFLDAPVPGASAFPMTIDRNTGLISWTPPLNTPVSVAFTVRVIDGRGRADTRTFTLPVAPQTAFNLPPVLQADLPQVLLAGADFARTVRATDPNRDVLTFSLVAPADGMAIDPAAGDLVWTPAESQAGTHRVTVRVSDGRGGIAERLWEVLVVLPNDPPRFDSVPSEPISVGAEWLYPLAASDPNGDPLRYRIVSAPAGATVTFNEALQRHELKWTPPSGSIGNHDFVLEVSDGRGGFDYQAFRITVQQYAPPNVRADDIPDVWVGEAWSYDIDADDAGNPSIDQLTFELVSPPSGVTLTESVPGRNNRLRWTPQAAVETEIVVRVTNHHGAWTLLTLRITPGVLGQANRAPEITSRPTGAILPGVRWTYQVLAQDPDPNDQVRFRLQSPLPAGMAGIVIDELTGLITWPSPTPGSHRLDITAYDRPNFALAARTTQTVWMVVSDNAPPRITSEPPPAPATAGVQYTYQVTATDPNPAHASGLRYELVPPEPGGTLPPGLVIGSTSGLLTWTPTNAGQYRVGVRAVDPEGASSTQVYTINVRTPQQATNNTPPAVAPTPAPRGQIGVNTLFAFQVPGSDADFDPLTYALINSPPAGMTISRGGLVQWTPAPNQLGAVVAVTVRLTDGRGGQTDVTYANLRVVQSAPNGTPTIDSTPPVAVQIGQLMSYLPVATDPDADRLVWALIDGPPDASIDPTTGALTWTPGGPDLGDHPIAIRAFDPSGASATQRFTLSVRAAATPPLITSAPPDVALKNAAAPAFEYVVRADDLDSPSVSFALQGAPANMRVETIQGSPRAARIVWDQQHMQLGIHTFTIVATDPSGEADSQQVTLTVVSSTAPVFSTPNPLPTHLPVNFEWTYRFRLLSASTATPTWGWSVPSGSTSVSIIPDPATDAPPGSFIFKWTPVTPTSTPTAIQITATAGVSSTLRFNVTVVSNVGAPDVPAVTGVAAQATRGRTLTYPVQATGAGTSPVLRFEFDPSTPPPAGMSINASSGVIAWNTRLYGNLGGPDETRTVMVRVIDETGRTTQRSFQFALLADAHDPQVVVQPGVDPVQPGSMLSLTVAASDDGVIASTRLFFVPGAGQPDVPLAVSPTGRATFEVPAGILPGTALHFRAEATDLAGNSSDETLTVHVADTSATTGPDIAIASPAEGQALRSPTPVVVGLTNNAQFSYVIDIAPAGSDDWTQLVSSVSTLNPATGLHAVGGAVTTIDTTAMRNGAYRLRVRATGGAFQSELVRDFSVAGDLKLGNFSLSFVDATVELAGVPLVIGRRYDTLQADQNLDFGLGWSLDFRTASLGVDARTLNDDDFYGPTFGIGTRVSVTLPDGTKAGFTFAPVAVSSGLFGDGYFRPAFTPDPGVNATLALTSEPLLYYFQGDAGGLGHWSTSDQTPYTPEATGADYVLTLQDGSRLIIGAVSGHMTAAVTPAGDRLEVLADGFASYNAAGQLLGALTFQRDGLDRITGVSLPGGASLEYHYDAQGRLVRFRDRAMADTLYAYGTDETAAGAPPLPPAYANFLTRITDPRGVVAASVRFDLASGRLLGIADAFGNVSSLTYSFSATINGRTAFAVESAGPAGVLAKTRVYRDEAGNVIRTAQRIDRGAAQLWQVVVYTYDASRNQTGVSRPVEVGGADVERDDDALLDAVTPDRSSPRRWASRATYNDRGNPLTQTDAAGRTTVFTYTGAGDVWTVTDPENNVTVHEYDAQRRIVRTSVNGVATVFEYHPASGQLFRTIRFDENGQPVVVSSADYDDRGRLLWSADASGVRTYFIYDAADRRIVSYVHWTDQHNTSVQRTLVDRALYDAEGRQTGSARYLFTGHWNHVTSPVDWSQVQLGDAVFGAAPLTTTRTEYDALGNPIRTFDAFGAQTRLFYDAAGRSVATEVDRLTEAGAPVTLRTLTVFDALGREVLRTDEHPAGTSAAVLATQSEYDGLGRVVKTHRVRIQSLAAAIVMSSPAAGFATITYNPLAAITRLATNETIYNALGQVEQTISPSGLRTRNVYDAAGRRTEVWQYIDLNADGIEEVLKTISDFDTAGRLIRSTDPSGRVAEFSYDDQGRTIRTRLIGDPANPADDIITDVFYDALGRKSREIAGRYALEDRSAYTPADLRFSTEYVYDDDGRLELVRMPEVANGLAGGAPVRPEYAYAYDTFGNRTTVDDPLEHRTRFTFDALGRQTHRALPLATSPTTGAFVERSVFNDTPLAALVQGGANLALSVGLGQLQSAHDFEGNRTDYLYDNTPAGRGRLAQKKVYDAGNVLRQTVTYKYDEYGRLTEVREDAAAGDVRVSRTTYDAEGRALSDIVRDAAANPIPGFDDLRRAYDDFGRLVRTWTESAGVNIQETVYTYDKLDRLKTVTVTRRNATALTQSEITAYRYNASGEMARQDQSNGVVVAYTYERFGRVETITHHAPDADPANLANNPVLVGFTYFYDKSHNKTRAVEHWLTPADQTVTTDWEYDAMGRLTLERVTTPSAELAALRAITTYLFDLASNRALVTLDRGADGTNDATTTYAFDANDRAVTEILNDANDAADRFTRFGWGNATTQLTKHVRTGLTDAAPLLETHTYAYDARGRMVTATVQPAVGAPTVTTYRYSDAGLRIEQSAGGVTTRYLFDALNPTGFEQVVQEQTNTGTGFARARAYTIGADVIATVDLLGAMTGLAYVHANDMAAEDGSTRALTSPTGALATGPGAVQRFFYDAYGVVRAAGSSVQAATAPQALTPLLYRGEAFDANTGLQYLRARMYSPHAGRLLTLDGFSGSATNPVSFNKYLYTASNPILYADPSGNQFNVVGALATYTIVATGLSILAPAIGAAYLGITGEISLLGVVRELGTPDPWLAAAAALGVGAAGSVALQALLLRGGATMAQKFTPALGAVFATVGLVQSLRLTYKLVTEPLPAKDKERYIATLLAGNILTLAFSTRQLYPKQWINKGRENDANFWQLSASDRALYARGQGYLPPNIYAKLKDLSPVARGRALEQQYKDSWLFWQALAKNSPITTWRWVNSGPTPDLRSFLTGPGGDTTWAAINALLQFLVD